MDADKRLHRGQIQEERKVGREELWQKGLSVNGDGHSSAPTGAGGTGTSTGAAKCPVSGAQGSLVSAEGSDTTAQPLLLCTHGSLWGHSSQGTEPRCVCGAVLGVKQLILLLDMIEYYQGDISCPSEQK